MQRSKEPTQAKQEIKSVGMALTSASDRAEAETLFTSIGEGAIVTDSKGNISRINKAAEDILGLRAEDVTGKWYPGVVIVEDENGNPIPNEERPITEVFMSNKPIFRKVYVRKKNGNRVALALTVSPVKHRGKPIGAIELFRDISDEVRLERARTEFIALASHQLRTPATAVKQYLHMLLDGFAGELTEPQKRFVLTANQGNDRQLRIINDILKVAAADSGDMVLQCAEIDLVELIQSMVDEYIPKLAKIRQKLVFTHPKTPVHARVDIHVFRMVLENLIDNAHKYSYPDKTIEITVARKKSGTSISVRDEGIGIRKSDVQRLFQKFVRLESPLSVSAGGTGLGLYWVKKVLELHGASLQVESRLGHGTIFTITLPSIK